MKLKGLIVYCLEENSLLLKINYSNPIDYYCILFRRKQPIIENQLL